MKIEYTSLLFFLIFCEHCKRIIWGVSEEDDCNFPLVEKNKLSWEYYSKSARTSRATDEQRADRKGKGITVGSSSFGTGTSISERPEGHMRWTNEQNENLLRYFYNYQGTKASRWKGRMRNWKKISAAWTVKYGYPVMSRTKTHAFFLRDKLHEAARNFDFDHPEGRNVDWTELLNDDIMKIYFDTEKGNELKHGERMYAEWVKMYPNYQNVSPEYLLNRAKAMMQNTRKLLPIDFGGEQPVVPKPGQHIVWTKEHEDFIIHLWKKYPRKMDHRKEKIFSDAVAKFEELKPVGSSRVYEHARWLHEKSRNLDGSMGKRREEGECSKLIVNGHVLWRPEHDKYLLELWKEKGRLKDVQRDWFYHKALEKFPELDELHAIQVYERARYLVKRARQSLTLGVLNPKRPHDRVKYLGNRKQKLQHSKDSVQEFPERESMEGIPRPYHMFINDQFTSSVSRGTDHHDKLIANTSSNPETTHGQLYTELASRIPNSGEQSPDTSLRLGL